jgi:hypothetical protein
MIIGITISIIINIFFIWYVYKLLKKLVFISDNIEDFLEILEDYSSHIESVYNMETYYGDATIEKLLEHSKEVVNEVKGYKDIYELIYDNEVEDEETIEGTPEE